MFQVKRANKSYECDNCRGEIKKGERYEWCRFTKVNYDEDYSCGYRMRCGSERITYRCHSYNCCLPKSCRIGDHRRLTTYRYIDLFGEDLQDKARDGQTMCEDCGYFEDEFYKLREEQINIILE